MIKRILASIALLVLFTVMPSLALAASSDIPDFTNHWLGYVSIGLFVFAYGLVIFEEVLHLRKSKPVMTVAGLIWILVAYVYHQNGYSSEEVNSILRHTFLEYAELAFFLLSAMTYINTVAERNIFQALRLKLVNMGLSYRALFWITGLIAFFLSPVADNLTTALVLGAVVMAVGIGKPTFVAVACVNIVVAANAGGAFSPFGDITTLMVWQKGLVDFFEFFHLFIPSAISWLIPAFIMSFAVDKSKPKASKEEDIVVKKGGFIISAMFFATIAFTVTLHNTLHLPPFLGMMTGLGALMGYSFFLRRDELKEWEPGEVTPQEGCKLIKKPFDVFISIKRAEWDTLIFFYGIILCVGGLSALGYLSSLSNFMYGELGPTAANSLVGVLSAIIDNIPVMFAVLTMAPEMSHGQWLLVTLTAGIGGSMLSIGSAAGVALMGQARGTYTFFSHLKWSWAIAIGYVAGIWAHILINGVG